MKYLTVTLKQTTTRRVHVNDLPKLVASGAQILSVNGKEMRGGIVRVAHVVPPQFKVKGNKGNGKTAPAKAKAKKPSKGTGLRPGSIGEGVFKMFQAAPNKRFTNKEISAKLKALNSKSAASTICNNIGMTLKKAILRDAVTGTYRLNPEYKAS